MRPDFTRYTLALLHETEVIYTSSQSGLRPLVNCLEKYKGIFEDCTLYDKVIGLAAAKCIVYSNMISVVEAGMVSMPAKAFLEKYHIHLTVTMLVDRILTKDQSAICPGELIALATDEPEDFLAKIRDLLKGGSPVSP
jgi:hypothetical protein